MAVSPLRIIRGYKSVIKTVCRLDRQNMREDNTMKAQRCQELVANYQDKRVVQLTANNNNLLVDSDLYLIPLVE